MQSYTKYLSQIAEVLEITTEYLLPGKGSKHKEKTVSDSDAISKGDIMAAFSKAARTCQTKRWTSFGPMRETISNISSPRGGKSRMENKLLGLYGYAGSGI